MRAIRAFTLMEVMVALILVGFVAAFLSPGFASQARQNTVSEVKSQAIDAAQRRLDTLRISDPATMPSTGSDTQNIQIANRTFAVTTQYCSTSSLCSIVTRHLKVTAKYRNVSYYVTETVFTQLR